MEQSPAQAELLCRGSAGLAGVRVRRIDWALGVPVVDGLAGGRGGDKLHRSGIEGWPSTV